MFKRFGIVVFLSLEFLYGTTYTVTTNADSLASGGVGVPGELRYGLNQVNQGAAINTIIFDLPSGSETITLNGILPIINIITYIAPTLQLIDGSNTLGSGKSVTIHGGGNWPGFL